jgi:hypothetical protein
MGREGLRYSPPNASLSGLSDAGKAIEILFGALAMQQWGIRPVPDEEKLDLSHYPEEIVEF